MAWSKLDEDGGSTNWEKKRAGKWWILVFCINVVNYKMRVIKYHSKRQNKVIHFPSSNIVSFHIFCLSFRNNSPANSFSSYPINSFSLKALNSCGRIKCSIKLFTFTNFDTMHIISECTIHILNLSNVEFSCVFLPSSVKL